MILVLQGFIFHRRSIIGLFFFYFKCLPYYVHLKKEFTKEERLIIMRTVSWKRFCLALLLSFACFFFIDLFTVKTNHVSGNGNLGLPFYPFACFFLLMVMYYLFATYLNRLKEHPLLLHLTTIVFTSICIMVCFSFAREKFLLRVAELQQEMAVSTTFIHDYGWLDIHLNNLYFNLYTYIDCISCFVLAGVYCMIRRRVG